MIKSVEFKNFKALRDTTLPLGRFTLLVGPNGSGKSTALEGVRALDIDGSVLSKAAGAENDPDVAIFVRWGEPYDGLIWKGRWPHELVFDRIEEIFAAGY